MFAGVFSASPNHKKHKSFNDGYDELRSRIINSICQANSHHSQNLGTKTNNNAIRHDK